MTIDQAYNLAVEHQRAGQMAQAEKIYRQILAQQPDHAPSLEQLGVLASGVGRYDAAAELIGRAVALRPENAGFRCNLGFMLSKLGRAPEAVAEYRKSIELNPQAYQTHFNLGNALRDQGLIGEAIASYERAVALAPGEVWPLVNLASTLRVADRLEDCLAAYRRALAISPESADILYNMGNALFDGGPKRHAEAMAAYRRAIAARPDHAPAWKGLGQAAHSAGMNQEAKQAYGRAVALRPDDPEAYWNLLQLHRLSAAEADDAPADSQPRLPYLGDKVVLLRCDRPTRERLRGVGLHGGYAVDPATGAEPWLQAQAAKADPKKLPELLGEYWLDWVRNEAAMSGTTCAVWLPEMPAAVADALRQVAGEDLIEIAGERAEDIHAELRARAVPPPDTAEKIFAVVTVRNGGMELLPHWLEHYTKLGADLLLVGVSGDITAENMAEIDRCARRWAFTRFQLSWTGALEIEHTGQRETACRRNGAIPRTWILHTDLDEMLEFPAPIREVTAAAARKGQDTVYGRFVDRVAADGSLPPVRPTPSIWEQYPVACRVSEAILKGLTQKVMLTRYSVHVGSGHHTAVGRAVQPPPLGSVQDYRVAHFKWHGDLISRLRWGIRLDNAGASWKLEVTRFLTWLDRHGGKMDLSDPALEARNTQPNPHCP